MPDPDRTTLSKAERDALRRIAERDGVSEDEAATRLCREALARLVKKRSGKPPAKVYTMRKRGI